MVVPVLMTSCQFSEKWNKGPVIAQASTMSSAIMKAAVLPAASVTQPANLSNRRLVFDIFRLVSTPAHD